MPAQDNAITTAQVCTGLDIEFVDNFRHEYDRFEEILGLFPAETANAGQALYQYKISGTLNTSTPGEGEETPISRYNADKISVGEMEVKRYAKQTTVEAILKSGFEVAVTKTDKKFHQQLRASILGNFFTFLANGTGSANGVGLKATLARMEATLQDIMETYGDEPGTVLFFVNQYDIADYLAEADVTTQTLFGMTYIKDFLGVEHILSTNKVPEGTVYCTPVENIHIRGVDFSTLEDAGLAYEVDSLGLIGIHHDPNYNRGAAQTYAMVGANFLPEVLDFIVKGTIYATTADVKDPRLASLSIGSLELSPAFTPAVTQYEATTKNATNTITAAAKAAGATVVIKNGSTTVASGNSATWAAGKNVVTVDVTHGTATKTYTVIVTKE